MDQRTGEEAIYRSPGIKIPNLIISVREVEGLKGIFRVHNPSADLIPAIDCILQINIFYKPVLSDLVRGWARPACLLMNTQGVWEGK